MMRVRLAVVGTCLAAIGWAAAAQGADGGGGTAVDDVRRSTRQLTIVSVRTGADGRAFVRVLVNARCGTASIGRTVRPAADGSFTLAATARGREPGVVRTARFAVTGSLAGAAGSGTVSVKLTFRRDGRVVGRCASGKRAWQVRTPAPETVAGPPRANTGYYGLTSQTAGRPHAFTLRVDARARRVQSAVFEYRHKCREGFYETSNITPGGRIAADGTFSLRERFTLRYSDSSERFVVKVDGRFTPNGVDGSLSVESVTRSTAGRVVDRCRTGRQTFTAVV